jgi:dolichyl-phosphate-mannose--protein O-mannosyl transferase
MHWTARIMLLIFLPIAVYITTFVFHFTILNMTGPGIDVFMQVMPR